MKTLILYYSYGGNTRKVAEMLQKKMGGDLAEIETVKPYIIPWSIRGSAK